MEEEGGRARHLEIFARDLVDWGMDQVTRPTGRKSVLLKPVVFLTWQASCLDHILGGG